MAEYLVTDTELTASAEAIRSKTGSTSSVEWVDGKGFADAIRSITGGGGSSSSTPNAEDYAF